METITIMAQALVKASKMELMRLDIQYIEPEDTLIGYLSLRSGKDVRVFVLKEDGTVSEPSK